jgi:hypothetical protein
VCIYIYNYVRALLDIDTVETEKGEMVSDGSTCQFREKSMAEILAMRVIIICVATALHILIHTA